MNFDAPTLEQLRARRSAKWRAYPADVLPAWVAEMDVPLAAPVKAALQGAIERDDCGYAWGEELPAALASFAAAWFGWELDPARVFLVPDVLVGIVETLRLLTAPGARVVVNSPVYPPFYSVVAETGRQIEDVPLVRTDGGWELDLAGLERAFAGGAAAYILCSPHNPLGRAWSAETLAAVASSAARHRVLVLADEVHAPLRLPGNEHVPFAPLAESAGADAVALLSASKAWNLAGLKCAQVIAASDAMRERLGRFPAEVKWRAGHLGVLAAQAAYRDGMPWLRELCAHLARNHDRFAALLGQRIPALTHRPPAAGYLAWIDCSALGLGEDPAAVFLGRGRVALSSGRPYGGVGGSFVRVNLGTTAALIDEIVARMATAVG